MYKSAVLHCGRKWCWREGNSCHGLSKESCVYILLFRNRYLKLTLFILYVNNSSDFSNYSLNSFLYKFFFFYQLLNSAFFPGANSESDESGKLSQHNKGYECSMVSAAATGTMQPTVHLSSPSLSSCTSFKPTTLPQTSGPESWLNGNSVQSAVQQWNIKKIKAFRNVYVCLRSQKISSAKFKNIKISSL